ncbi:MAG: hypothetical protein ABI963_08275 [Rhizomicrobium sp.]
MTKPKPFASLKNLTVPFGMIVLTEFPESFCGPPKRLGLSNIYVFTALQRDPAQAKPNTRILADLAAALLNNPART